MKIEEKPLGVSFDQVLMDGACRESAIDIPPLRPEKYGVTAREFAEAKRCKPCTAREWLRTHKYKSESMRCKTLPKGKLVITEVFTKP